MSHPAFTRDPHEGIAESFVHSQARRSQSDAGLRHAQPNPRIDRAWSEIVFIRRDIPVYIEKCHARLGEFPVQPVPLRILISPKR